MIEPMTAPMMPAGCRNPSAAQVAALVRDPRVRHVVVHTGNVQPELVETARALGVHGYLSTTLPPATSSRRSRQCTPGSGSSASRRAAPPARSDSIGRAAPRGTDRESAILALITQGKNNATSPSSPT